MIEIIDFGLNYPAAFVLLAFAALGLAVALIITFINWIRK